MRSTDRNDLHTVIGKVDRILAVFTLDDHELTLAELANRTAIPKTTLHRLAGSLQDIDVLERVGDRYRLGTRLFELGQLVPRQRTLRDAALPFMEDLFEATHETVHLAVADGLEVLYIDKLMGHRVVAAPSRVAGRMPMHCTALGKVMLAFSPPDLAERVIAQGLAPRTAYTIVTPAVLVDQLRTIVSRGVAFEYEESALGVGCAAAPIMGRQRRLVAALSVAAPLIRLDPAQVARAVQTAALALSRSMRG